MSVGSQTTKKGCLIVSSEILTEYMDWTSLRTGATKLQKSDIEGVSEFFIGEGSNCILVFTIQIGKKNCKLKFNDIVQGRMARYWFENKLQEQKKAD